MYKLLQVLMMNNNFTLRRQFNPVRIRKMLRGLSFCIGFMMLFGFPTDETGITIYLFIWIPAALTFIALSGAFNKVIKK